MCRVGVILYRVEKRKKNMWVPIFCVEGSRKCISLYQGYQNAIFWYWGLENAFMYMKVLKLPIFGIGGLENAFLYMKVLKLPIFAIGGIKNAIFGMVEVPKIRKMSCLPPSPM